MKKYCLFVLAFVLTAAMLVGCGCTNQDMGTDNAPTVLPTNEEVMPTTRATTAPTTRPTTEATTEASTEPSATIDRGNGPLEETGTDTTGETGGNARGILGGGSGSGAGIGSSGSVGGSMSRG